MATTAGAIRDRAIAVIAALVPRADSDVPFIAFRNEDDANIRTWLKTRPASAERRFQARNTNDSPMTTVSNTDVEERLVTVEILIAYPQSHRWGATNGLGRDDVMNLDEHQIDHAIGMTGRGNFAPPYPDACWRESGPKGASGILPRDSSIPGVDLVVLRYAYAYRRTMT